MSIQAARSAPVKKRVAGAMVALVTASLTAGAAYGDNNGDSMFSLRGFGTFGVVHSDQDQADFVGDLTHLDGAGYSKSWAMSVDSKLGLQLDARFTDKLSGALQVVTQYDHRGDYTPDVEWAYLGYELTPGLTVRLGRIVTPTFMESETRLVGYTYPWIRPPMELYGTNPTTNKDGIDVQYQFLVGEVFNTFQLSYGKNSLDAPDDLEFDARSGLDLLYRLEYRDTEFRASYSTVELDLSSPDLDALFDGFERFGTLVPGPAGEQALINARRFRTDDSRVEFYSIGVKHRPGDWLFRAEWEQFDAGRSSLSDTTAWYLTVGHRFGAFTPFVTVAEVTPDEPRPTNIPTQGLPPAPAGMAAALNAGLDAAIRRTATDQETYTAGVRWDIVSNIALKMQYQQLRTRSGSSGRLSNVQPGFESGDKANLLSIAVDFVF